MALSAIGCQASVPLFDSDQDGILVGADCDDEDAGACPGGECVVRSVSAGEREGGEAVQDVGLIDRDLDLEIYGVIDDSGYLESGEAPFDLHGWYYGDLDYFSLEMKTPEASSLALSWSDPAADLDLGLFSVEHSSGELTLLELADTRSGSGEHIECFALASEQLYVLVVAGFAGEGVDYLLRVATP